MNRTMRSVGVGALFSLSFAVAAMRAQQPAAEPQASSQTVQTPRELVPTLPVPRLMKFAGMLQDEQGKPRSGVVGVSFALYKDQEGGVALWVETQNVELDEQGRYTVLLGATKNEGLPLELFSAGEPLWLGVQVNLPREMEHGRVLLVSVPYALKAADADTLGGMPLSSFVLATPQSGAPGGSMVPNKRAIATGAATIGGGGTQNFVAKFDATGANVVNSLIFDNGTNVGIGTSSPAAALHVNGNTLLVTSATTAQLQFSGSASEARFGQDGNGAFFASDSPGKAVRFYTNNGTLNEGLRITSAGNVGIGTTTPADTLDVFGTATNGGGQAVFVQGGSSTGASGTAEDGIDPVGGDASGTSGLGGFGVFAMGGNATAAGGSAGDGGQFIGGTGSNGAFNGFAGFFTGDVQVTGAITAGVKDFKIDHPLDPANKYLVHASVESSEMLNIYTGNATLDTSGGASVSLPGWFETVNKDFRYQLTAVGAPGPNLYIAQEIQGGRFVIAGGQPGMKVSWQVTGVRQDAFAQAHPLVVEEEKLPIERGYYIQPELYGASEEKGIQWARHPQLMTKMKERKAKQAQAEPNLPAAAPLGSRPVAAEPPPGSTKQ